MLPHSYCILEFAQELPARSISRSSLRALPGASLLLPVGLEGGQKDTKIKNGSLTQAKDVKATGKVSFWKKGTQLDHWGGLLMLLGMRDSPYSTVHQTGVQACSSNFLFI